MNKNEFDSEYCNVKYVEKDNVVFLTWKKYCSHDDYRTPTTFAVELLKKFKNSYFICDARYGFEDHKDDVEWGFKVYLPSMAQTTCKTVVFIMNEVNDTEEEMDMWTKEFIRYFTVRKVPCYKDGVNFIKQTLKIIE